MDETIEKIVRYEYEMLDKVNNKGGRAWCQDHFDAFRIMRAAQFLAWPDEIRESYLEDLQVAHETGRNLIFEKYAWMMQFSHPEDFAKVEHTLPSFSSSYLEQVAEIVAIQLDWAIDFEKRYPNISGTGRPLRSSEDTPWATSVETYARGEISTYSERTVGLYYQFVKACKAGGRNLTTEVRENQLKLQGWKSLDQAEAAAGQG